MTARGGDAVRTHIETLCVRRAAMKPWVRLLPFAVFLFILPFPGTVALRLLALAGGLLASAWSWHKEGLPQIPAKAALLLWLGCALLSLITAVDPAYSLGEIKNEIGYAMVAYLGFLTLTRTRADAGSARHGADPGQPGARRVRPVGVCFLGLGVLERTRACRRFGQLHQLFARAASGSAMGGQRAAA